MSISLATASPSGPGVSRTSSVAWASEGMTLDCGTPCTGDCTTVGVTVGGRRCGLRRQSRRSRRSSAGASRSRAPSALIGFTPASGIAPWAMRPRAVTRAHTTPRCSRHSSFCSGSQMIAAVERTPQRRGAQMLGADHVAFLVDQRADDEAAAETRATTLDGGGGDHRRGETTLHVGAAAAVDPAVDQVGAERRVAPLGGIALGDDVGVAFEEQRRAARLADPRQHVGPAGRDLVDLDLEALAAQPALHVGGDGGLGGGGIARADHAGDADQVTGELDELALVDTREHGGRAHGGHAGRAYC